VDVVEVAGHSVEADGSKKLFLVKLTVLLAKLGVTLRWDLSEFVIEWHMLWFLSGKGIKSGRFD